MTLTDRLTALARLGDHLRGPEDEFLNALMQRTEFNNAWFTLENQRRSLASIAGEFLDREKLAAWTANYPALTSDPVSAPATTVALVLAGNLPLVGFHDLLCTFVAGHRARIKLSSKDEYVLPYLLQLLARFDDSSGAYFDVVDRLEDYDAVIATGSNNSARYFEAYFGRHPHIIRRNRNAVAVLTGQETETELRALGEDVFTYFGLGCRNVSKLYVPRDYDFARLLDTFHEWRHFQRHRKWKNNFDYNHALLTLNGEPFRYNGAVIIREAPALASHIAGLYYEHYDTTDHLVATLRERAEEIQLIVARPDTLPLPTHDFGTAQRPGLADYADGVDTLAFLLALGDRGTRPVA